MAGLLRCSDPSCGAWLDGEDSDSALLTTFPQDMVRCLEQLTHGAAVLFCEKGHKNTLTRPALCMDQQCRFGVLYIPPEQADHADAIEASLRDKVAIIRPVSDQRAFRRAFIELFIVRHITVLNEFAFAHRPFEWVAVNKDRLGPEFMGAGFLLTEGAFSLGLSSVEDASPNNIVYPFRPHEEVEDLMTVEGNQAARNHTAGVLASMILGLFLVQTIEIMTQRSMSGQMEIMESLVPGPLLRTDVSDLIAKKLSNHLADTKLGRPGATALRYCMEMLHALVHRACGTLNPRRAEWTFILVRYEFERRLDGNSEGLLLAPSILWQTIDVQLFWAVVWGFADNLEESGKDRLSTSEHLIDTVQRIFPSIDRRQIRSVVLAPISSRKPPDLSSLSGETPTSPNEARPGSGPMHLETKALSVVDGRSASAQAVAQTAYRALLKEQRENTPNGTITVIQVTGDLVMSDKFLNYGVAGAVGPNASISGGTFTQTQAVPHPDLSQLLADLRKLAEALESRATTPDQKLDGDFLARATGALEKGDEATFLATLRRCSLWVLNVAKEVGVEVAAKAISGAMGSG